MTRKATLALAAFAAVVFPQTLAAEPPFPERLLLVQYVALGIDLGDRIIAGEALTSEAWRATPGERKALEEIRQRLEGWGRYVVENQVSKAQVLLVVREGRRASIGGGAGVGSGGGVPPIERRRQPTSGAGVQPSVGAAFSSPDDLLVVYETGRSPGSFLWRGLEPEGLSGKIPLFEAFQADVEKAAAQRKKP